MLRIKVGSFAPNQPEGFEERLRAWLNSEGKISDVDGRGLEFYWARRKSEPGSNLMKIAEALNAAPRPLSIRRLLNRLTDLTEEQIRTGVMRMVKDGEIEATPQRLNGYKYFLYSLTPDGVEAWEKRTEQYELGKPVALEIWRVCKIQGLKKGSRVDPKVIREAMGRTGPEFWAGWRTLVSAGRIAVAYNADGPGKHAYYL